MPFPGNRQSLFHSHSSASYSAPQVETRGKCPKRSTMTSSFLRGPTYQHSRNFPECSQEVTVGKELLFTLDTAFFCSQLHFFVKHCTAFWLRLKRVSVMISVVPLVVTNAFSLPVCRTGKPRMRLPSYGRSVVG